MKFQSITTNPTGLLHAITDTGHFWRQDESGKWHRIDLPAEVGVPVQVVTHLGSRFHVLNTSGEIWLRTTDSYGGTNPHRWHRVEDLPS